MKTPLLSLLLLLLFSCIVITNSNAQIDTINVTANEDSLIFQSHSSINLSAISVVRFASSAKAYVNWTAPVVSSTSYTLKYKLLGATTWTSVSNSTLEKILTSLQ